jgi:hypothetical protein
MLSRVVFISLATFGLITAACSSGDEGGPNQQASGGVGGALGSGGASSTDLGGSTLGNGGAMLGSGGSTAVGGSGNIGNTAGAGNAAGSSNAGGASGGGGSSNAGGASGGGGSGNAGAGNGGTAGAGGGSPTGGTAGMTGMGGTGNGGMGGGGGMPQAGTPQLPTAMGDCPKFTNNGTITVGRMSGIVTYIDPDAKNKPDPGGPLILYYHATASNPSEVTRGFGMANIQAVTAAGGVVVSFKSTACSGCQTTDDNYWYVQDDPIQDTVVACAIQQAKINVKQIHALGWSAGALHTMHVALARSNYMASVISYSGGMPLGTQVQNANNHVASVQTYGATNDVVIIDFNQNSKAYYSAYQPKGYYTMMCEHPGGHMIDAQVAPHSLEFFKAHPFEVNPEPYAQAIPMGWPTYCKNMP